MASSSASAAAAHLQLTRAWCSQASEAAGVPPPLQLLPSLPVQSNPAWCRAPSFAAAAALLVPPASAGGSSGSWPAPSAADLAAAAAVAGSTGLASRMLWTAGCQQLHFVYSTPYDHLAGLAHRQAQLLPMTLANLPPRSGSCGSAPIAATAEQEAAEQQQQAERIFLEVAADQRAGGLRLLGWMLSHLFRWLFNSELYVDAEGLGRLRQLHLQGGAEGSGQQGRASIVYIPAHKSHLDYLMLSYVLFGAGLPCPHIAAGANLRLPLVGRLLRACGAFFIRRTSRGAPDSHLYKAVLAAYVHALLQAGHSLEFFIEGGRSRDGRVNPPKLGMLRMVVDAMAAGNVTRPVYVVPTAMSYDAVIEEGSLAAQLAGAAKKSESLAGLAGTCWGILANALHSRWRRYLLGLGAGGYCGRATVAFGQPISLHQWLEEHRAQLEAGGAAERAAVAALGDAVTAGIRTASVLSSSALLLGALFAEQHVPRGEQAEQLGERTSASSTTVAAAAAGMEWLADELQQRGAPVVRLPRDAVDSPARQQLLLLHLASMLPQCCEVVPAQPPAQQAALSLRRGVIATLIAHSRLNQLLPWLAPEGLLVAALLGAGGAAGKQQGLDRAALLDGAAWLRCVLAPEIDTALRPGALTSLADFEPALQRLLASGALLEKQGRLQLADGSSPARRGALLAAALLAPLLATYAEVLRSAQAALAAAGPRGCTHKALCSAAQKRLLALAGSDGSDAAGGAALAVPSSALVQNALRSFAALGVLAPAPLQQAEQQQQQQQQTGGLPNGKAAEAGSPQGPVGEEEQALLGRSASASSSSGGEGEGGGVDEEYAVDPPTPVCSPQPSSKPLNAAAGPELETSSATAATPERGSPAAQRRSFERRRAAREKLQQRVAAGGGDGKGGKSGSSRSGSDSELDPMAESVAANLCQLDGSSPVAVPAPSPRPTQAGGQVAPTGVAAAAAGGASQHSYHHQADAPLVLSQSQAVVRQLAQRMGAPLAAFA